MAKKRSPRKKRSQKWKQFESLVARIQQGFTPDAKVTLDDKIMGRRSGVSRQIDISVRRSIGQFNILVVIDCKDYKNPVDVKDVEDFLGLVEDVGANKSALVSSSGFSEAAKTRAKDAGVDVYRLVDAEDHDWRSYVAIPMVCDFRGFGMGNFIIHGSKLICEELAQLDTNNLPVYDQNQEYIGVPLTLLWAMWNRREISEEPGPRRVLLKPDPIFAKAQNGEFAQIEIVGDFEILRKLYFGELPLTKFSGFRDEVTGNVVLPSNTEIITDVLDTVEVETNWQRVPSIDTLAVKPVMILTAFDYYPSTVPDDFRFPKVSGT